MKRQWWTTLVHNGVRFPSPYKPHGVKMLYKGNPVDLTPEQEEVATFYAAMMDTSCVEWKHFNENFMKDWRKVLGENHVIQNFGDCDFTPIFEWHQMKMEIRRQWTTGEKATLKAESALRAEKYLWVYVDGVKTKANCRVDPPGLFRGNLDNPKSGKVQWRILPRDVIINIGEGAPIPDCPIPGESWKEVRHDNTVRWIASWKDPINPGQFKCVFLPPKQARVTKEICKRQGGHQRITNTANLLKTGGYNLRIRKC